MILTVLFLVLAIPAVLALAPSLGLLGLVILRGVFKYGGLVGLLWFAVYLKTTH